jgi:hypothetical protein
MRLRHYIYKKSMSKDRSGASSAMLALVVIVLVIAAGLYSAGYFNPAQATDDQTTVVEGPRGPRGYTGASGADGLDGTGTSMASYVIYQDDSGTTYAKNASTGTVDYSGTNATYVIQSSINRISSGIIFIQPGTYELRAYQRTWLSNHELAALQIKNVTGVSLIGSGMGSTIFRMADHQNYANHLAIMLDMWNADRVRVSDITFDGNRAQQNTTAYIDGNGLILSGGDRGNCIYQDLELKNSFGTGLYLGNNRGFVSYDSWERDAYVGDIHCYNNSQQDICSDNVVGTIYENVYIQRASADTVHIGIYVFGVTTDWQTRSDNTVFNNIYLTNAELAITHASGIAVRGLRVSNPDIATSSGSVHVLSSMNITIRLDSIERRVDSGYGIFVSEANVDIYGGLIKARVGISSGDLGSATIHGTTVNATHIALASSDNGSLFAEGVYISGHVTYMFDALDTSKLVMTGVYSEFNSTSYVAAGVTFLHSGNINCGIVGG